MQPFVNTYEIGSRIRTFRQIYGISQERLAELVGVTPQQIQKYETAKTKISTDKLQLIANALHIRVSVFFSVHSEELALNELELAFIRKLRALKCRQAQESLLVILDKMAKG